MHEELNNIPVQCMDSSYYNEFTVFLFINVNAFEHMASAFAFLIRFHVSLMCEHVFANLSSPMGAQ